MAAHHGRPGGRLTEVLALFVVIVLSIAALVGIPFLAIFILDSEGDGSRYSILFGWGLALVALTPIWKALLRYYKYDPDTMKPILTKENPDDSHGD